MEGRLTCFVVHRTPVFLHPSSALFNRAPEVRYIVYLSVGCRTDETAFTVVCVPRVGQLFSRIHARSHGYRASLVDRGYVHLFLSSLVVTRFTSSLCDDEGGSTRFR